MKSRFATLAFHREVAATPAALWFAWTSPGARAEWSAPSPEVTIETLSADLRTGGEEITLCRVEGQPDIRCDLRWLALQPERRSVSTEIISRDSVMLSAALVTADLAPHGEGASLQLTVQLASLAEDMEPGYQAGFAAALDNLVALAHRTMVLQREIAAPPALVWQAWADPKALPLWWGPEGFSCRTKRIDLRAGGEWVFDMIGPDGTVFPNHHRISRHDREARIDYTLHWGENGPKHADASAIFEDLGGATRVSLCMTFGDQAEYDQARGFGAYELGLQTLDKLARHLGVA